MGNHNQKAVFYENKHHHVSIEDFSGLCVFLNELDSQFISTPHANKKILQLQIHEHTLFLIDSNRIEPSLIQTALKSIQSSSLISIIFIGHEEVYFDTNQDKFLTSFFPLPANGNSVLAQLQNQLNFQKYHLQDMKNNISDGDSVEFMKSISKDLSSVHNYEELLALILQKARDLTGADAGAIYTVQYDHQSKSPAGNIHFESAQNDTIELPVNKMVIPLNKNSIVGNVILAKEAIVIDDLYQTDSRHRYFELISRRSKSFDKTTGYESRSMLSVPIMNLNDDVIGVIQLINCKLSDSIDAAKPFAPQILPFQNNHIKQAEMVATQAGTALENRLLTKEVQRLFEAFVNASIKAIEQRDPTTSGHSHRVAKLTVALANEVADIGEGIFKNTSFSRQQLKEIEYASLLHDFGKVGVRENVLTKAFKLYDWELENVLQRVEIAKTIAEMDYYKSIHLGTSVKEATEIRDIKRTRLKKVETMIQTANKPAILEEEVSNEIQKLRDEFFINVEGTPFSILNDNEIASLSIKKGSLTSDEFSQIKSHVSMSFEFLKQIPWGKTLSRVPVIAGMHHEKMDGSGYPHGVKGNQIPVEARMMTIVDIFDALAASDRPYKKALPMDRALDIIGMEVRSGKCDPDLFEIFKAKEVFRLIKS